MTTEYADAQHGSLNAYASLAKRTGLPLSHIVQMAEENRLGELFDERGRLDGTPQGPLEALRQLERMRPPGAGGLSPGAANVVLRSKMSKWDAEIRRRNQLGRLHAQCRLDALDAMRARWQE
jgi:hypothetical protein